MLQRAPSCLAVGSASAKSPHNFNDSLVGFCHHLQLRVHHTSIYTNGPANQRPRTVHCGGCQCSTRYAPLGSLLRRISFIENVLLVVAHKASISQTKARRLTMARNRVLATCCGHDCGSQGGAGTRLRMSSNLSSSAHRWHMSQRFAVPMPVLPEMTS